MVLIILKRTNMLQSYCLVSRSHHTVAMRRRADEYHRSWYITRVMGHWSINRDMKGLASLVSVHVVHATIFLFLCQTHMHYSIVYSVGLMIKNAWGWSRSRGFWELFCVGVTRPYEHSPSWQWSVAVIPSILHSNKSWNEESSNTHRSESRWAWIHTNTSPSELIDCFIKTTCNENSIY